MGYVGIIIGHRYNNKRMVKTLVIGFVLYKSVKNKSKILKGDKSYYGIHKF